VYSWHGLATVIAAGAGGTLDIVVGADMPDYSGAIRILTNTQVTIEGRCFFADASRAGRFFEVESGGTLVLNSLTLKNGVVFLVCGNHLPENCRADCYVLRDFQLKYLFFSDCLPPNCHQQRTMLLRAKCDKPECTLIIVPTLGTWKDLLTFP
jgi:hypothetical protein